MKMIFVLRKMKFVLYRRCLDTINIYYVKGSRWVPSSQRRKENILTTYHRIIHGFVPNYLQDLLAPLVDDS